MLFAGLTYTRILIDLYIHMLTHMRRHLCVCLRAYIYTHYIYINRERERRERETEAEGERQMDRQIDVERERCIDIFTGIQYTDTCLQVYRH